MFFCTMTLKVSCKHFGSSNLCICVFLAQIHTQPSSNVAIIQLNDDPPSYPHSPVFSDSLETPPPKYEEWFKNEIFVVAQRNKM